MEAEFATVVDNELQEPEKVFGSPRRFIRGPLVHRTGRSYHLPIGGAIYFDTGVMEIATPMIEIERGCGARATRSLWENLGFLRGELEVRERDAGRRCGWSASARTTTCRSTCRNRSARRGAASSGWRTCSRTCWPRQ